MVFKAQEYMFGSNFHATNFSERGPNFDARSGNATSCDAGSYDTMS